MEQAPTYFFISYLPPERRGLQYNWTRSQRTPHGFPCRRSGPSNPYRDLKRGAQELTSKSVTFRSSKHKYKTLNLTDSVCYLPSEGRLVLTFGYSISHHLLGLIDQFTQYDLLSIRKLNSIYSIRLFELLSQYRSTGFRVETLDNIRFSLNVKYVKYGDLKRFVIQKAVDELNAKSHLKITFEPVKKGRAVSAIKFFFSEDKQQDIFDT